MSRTSPSSSSPSSLGPSHPATRRSLQRPLLALWAAVGLAGCLRSAPPAEDHAPRPAADLAPAPRSASPAIKITQITFAGPAGHRPDARFSRGETVTCLFTASGFTYRDGRADLVADVEVLGPGAQRVLHEPSLPLLKGPAPTARPGSLRSVASLRISPAASPGKYRVTILARDLLGGRVGEGVGSFTLVGSAPPRSDALTIADARLAAGVEVPAGSVQPLAFTVSGLHARGAKGPTTLELKLTATTLDRAGQKAAQDVGTLKRQLPFAPLAYPAELQIDLPSSLAPGPYTVVLKVEDVASGRTATARVPLRVVPATFAIFSAHLHDAAGLPRERFLLGEQVFIRFSLHGLKSAAGQVKAEVDLAIGGPEGGVYLATKAAARAEGKTGRAAAAAGRFATQIPLVLPNLAPRGKYRLLLRARDLLASRETLHEHAFTLDGAPPPRLGSFKIDTLDVRDRPDLPPLPGDTFGVGRTYHLTLSIGGTKHKSPRKMHFTSDIVGHLRLSDLRGAVVLEEKELFRFNKELTYRPLRLLLPASWSLPQNLRPGLYNLQINAEDRQDNRVSQLHRRVEVRRGPPAPAIIFPPQKKN